MPLTRWPALAYSSVIFALVIGAVAWAGSSAEAHVGKRQGLTFQDTRPMKLTWDEARDGLEVKFCNLDSDPAPRVKDGLAGFRFKSGGEFVDDRAVWRDAGAKTRLARGECDTLRVQLREARVVDPGEYSGMLVVTSGGAGGARRRVTVTVPGEEGKAESKATPLSEPTSFTAKKWGPFDASLDDGGKLPLERAKPGNTRLEFPDPGDLAGTIVNGTDVASVYVNGPPERRPDEGFVLLPLRVEGIDHVGDYSGTLDLAPEGTTEPQPVEVSIGVTDHWIGAVIAALLGTLVGLGTQWYWRRFKVKQNLDKRLDALDEAYVQGARDLHADFGYLEIQDPTAEALREYVAGVRQAIAVDMKSSWYFEPDREGYKSIVASIARAEDDAELLGSKTGLGKRLKDLDEALERLAGAVGDLRVDRLPALIAAAATVSRGGHLAVGEATARAKTAGEYVGMVDQFNRLAQQVRRLEPWATRLFQDFVNDPSPWTPLELDQLFHADAKIREAKNEMLDATDATVLKDLGAAADLDAAYGVLAVLGSRHGVWWSDAEAAEEAVAAAGSEMYLFGARVPVPSLLERLPFVGALIAEAAQAAVLRKSLGRVADWAFLVLAFVTGLFAALSAFYFGKTWGTTVDYLTVILIGTGTQVLTSGVLDVITKRTVGTRSARVVEGDKPATAAPAVTVASAPVTGSG